MSLRCCVATSHRPTCSHRPSAARGAEPAAPAGALGGIPGPASDAAALAPPPGPSALDLPDHLHRPTADLRRGAAAGRAACPRESMVGLPASTASCCALASGCRPARSAGFCAPTALTPHRGVPRRAGGRSCAGRPPGSSRVTSSPSTRSSCGTCMRYSSSSSPAGGSILSASPTIPPACGSPSRPAT
jgi:hypothetical protein